MANASLWATRLTTTSSNDLENEIHFANLLPPNLAHSARFLCQDHNNKSHFSSSASLYLILFLLGWAVQGCPGVNERERGFC